MNTTRVARNVAAAVVAGIAAWSSYQHMVTVALNVGERPDVAYLVPLSVDGLLVVASVAMVDDKKAGRTVRTSAKVAFVAGVLASVAANVSAAHPTIGARIVAAWPALALLLTVELLTRSGKRSSAESGSAAAVDVVNVTAGEPASVAQEATVDPATVGPRPTVAAPRAPKRQPSAADRIAAAIARNPRASDAAIAAKLHLAEQTVRRHRSRHADVSVTAPETTEPVAHNGVRVDLADAVVSS